ncbi:MAG: flavodoxin-dependent (E)-4-hydroxy-3-methylbut-2-enyl-diphosphate synthase [bacterium]
MRKLTREVVVGNNIKNVKIGGDNLISIQSMCNTDTRDANKTIEQIKSLEEEGCEIIRVAVPDLEAVESIKKIKQNISIPLVADIHFDYRLALESIKNGVDKIRINPGNIGDEARIKQVIELAKERNIPIRIGVNSGSLEKDLINKYKGVTVDGLVESALRHVNIIESYNYNNIIVSIKSSNVPSTIEAYTKLSNKIDYPLHLGITEAGTVWGGSIKSAVGVGSILSMGIGDTIRISLTGDPLEEIRVGKEILKSLELRRFGIEFVSCPTCGRTEVDLIKIANEVEDKCRKIDKNIKVAVMGCIVNGPGEAREADIGIAGGNGYGIIFKKGVVIKRVPEEELIKELLELVEEL